MKKIFLISLILMIGLVITATGTFAGEMTTANIHKASNLIGTTVRNQQGDVLGKIKDLTIDAQAGRVTFAILSRGGIMGVGDKLVAVPMNALTFKDDQTVIINITKEKLASAPIFDNKTWPDMTNRQWNEDTNRYYGISPYYEEMGSTPMMEKKGSEEMMHKDKSMHEEMKEKMGDTMKDKMDKMYDEKVK